MKEHPIIFSTDMVKAILEGRKTQTRRVIKPQPPNSWKFDGFYDNGDISFSHPAGVKKIHKCSYGKVGDRLWVRETWEESIKNLFGKSVILYKADYIDKPDDIANASKWKSPIYMSRWASRITLEITDIRVERLQEITANDCVKEGCGRTLGTNPHYHPRDRFKDLWNSIYARNDRPDGYCKYSWENNPWVWMISFKRLKTKH